MLVRDYSWRAWLIDFNLRSMREESVMSSLMEMGALAEPLRLTMGTSEGECWVSFPSGMDVMYRLLALRRTGGRSFEFMVSVLLISIGMPE